VGGLGKTFKKVGKKFLKNDRNLYEKITLIFFHGLNPPNIPVTILTFLWGGDKFIHSLREGETYRFPVHPPT